MRLSWQSALPAALLAVGLLTLAGTPARTADDKKPADKADTDKVPFAGNWKVTVLFGGIIENSSFLLKIEGKDGKPVVSLLDMSPDVKGAAKFEKGEATAKAVHFTIDIQGNPIVATAYPPKDGNDKEPKKLLGVANFNRQRLLLILDKTDATEVDKQNSKPTDGFQDYQKAQANKDDKEKEAALKDVLDKNEAKPIALAAASALVPVVAKTAEKPEEIKAAADRAIKLASAYGPEKELEVTIGAANAVLKSEKHADLAMDYARKAEKDLTKDSPPDLAILALKALAKSLHNAKKDDEAKSLDARIAKLDKELDEEFEKTSIPFKTEAFKGRKAASHRVSVVELFTGAQCPPCVAADIAFDAGIKTFKPKDVVFLEYHLHIPRPDALTNADSEARQKFYGDEIKGTPTAFVDGKTTPGLGGGKGGGEKAFETLRKLIEEALETDAPAEMQVVAKREGDKIEAEAKVVDLKKPDDKLRLHFVLVEEVVRYPGTNGQRLHHDVVRALPGGVEGTALKEATSTNKVTIDLAEVKKNLTTYLNEANEKRPFLDDERPMDLAHLKVVAFIQNDDSKEILQAAQVEVPAAK